ncbi:hypothetical protein TNCV_3369901 [Trichonephila clavipes]|uniref:Uncharacterized protein n=1 Tax=Trichonephila clavipes TaxID=2585209 RepID=A0A8X6UPN2_TRICX|nr:hypothetical protein TNCV_3369901 [Trichonephila clavipes]
MYPIIEKFRFHRSHLFAGNIVEIVRIDTSSQVFVVFPTSTQAEFSTMGSNLYTGGTKFPKCGGASPPRTAFVHVPNFDQNRKFFQSRPLHRRSIHAEFKPLHRLNEVFENGGASPFTDAAVHCPDFGSKSKFYRSRPSPIICGRQQGVQDFCLSYGLFNIKQKLIKKVVFNR